MAIQYKNIVLFLYVQEATSWVYHHFTHRQKIGCHGLRRPSHGTVSCLHHGSPVDCHGESLTGTVADYECDQYYVPEPVQIIECLPNGTWSLREPTCVPDCGRQKNFISLIRNGPVATPGFFPWQVAIYNLVEKGYEFWCGGSLISEYSVLTAAHCIWKIPKIDLVTVFGKFFRDFNAMEDNIQRRRVARVELLRSYQDVSGNYNGDLAMIFLEKAIEINEFVRPVCIDWKQEHVENQLMEGSLGTVLGWGLTENDTFSNVLKSVNLPVKSDEICISQQPLDFRKFVTYTSFCAGFVNGSGVCNGDSGGGLSFIDKKSDRWYLQGIVSVSPRRRGTFFCDPNHYTVFTKVTVFMKWLVQMKQFEQELLQSATKQITL